jgi:hypothetical protein
MSISTRQAEVVPGGQLFVQLRGGGGRGLDRFAAGARALAQHGEVLDLDLVHG